MNSKFLSGILLLLILHLSIALNSCLPTKNEENIDETQENDMSFYRLPNSTSPLEQLIRLQPFINGNQSIHGYTEITFKVLQPTSNITLHMADIVTLNDTIKISSKEEPQQSISIKRNIYDPERQFFIAVLGEELEAQRIYVLSMNFVGYLNDNLIGFYRSFYTLSNGEKKLFAVSQFASNYARYAFPCYDEPAMKAKFKVELGREESLNAVSNMPKESTRPIDGQPGWVLDTFLTSPRMSSYLVAFLISDFVGTVNTHETQVLYRVWVRENVQNQTTYAMNITPSVMNYFENYFNIEYPLPKQDMAAVPDFYYGGMENWGLINYRESRLLYDPLFSSAEDIQRSCIIVAHELAHNWYGNLVTMEWWNDVWLNEGFATFMQYLGCDSVEPRFRVLDQFTLDELHVAMERDSLASSHPVSNPITSPDQIHDVYDTIAYKKGGSLIRMMNSFLTPTTFQQGVSNYVTNFAYSNSNQNDLWHYLTQQGHIDGTLPKNWTMKDIMDSWTLQSGYPVLSIKRSQNNTATIEQERFSTSSTVQNSSSSNENLWWIPLTFVSEESPDFSEMIPKYWMTNEEKEISLSGFPSKEKWVIFNVLQTGFYRVNYDEENWNALIAQLLRKNNVISTLNRAQILDDAYNLAIAGILPYATALRINTYLDQENEYVPLKAALKQLEYLNYMFVRTSKYIGMKTYMTEILGPLYDAVGFDDQMEDLHQDHLKRSLILSWACRVRYEPCVRNSVALYDQWMLDSSNHSIIPVNSRRTVYCTAISKGKEMKWDFAYKQYLNTNIGNEKDNLLYGMGCTQEIWLIQRYLELTFKGNEAVRKQDVDKVFSSLSTTVIGNMLAWDYLRENKDHIIEYCGKSCISSLTKIVAENFNSKQQLEELEQFQKDLGLSVNLKQSLEKTRNNIQWMNDYFDVIANWFTENGYGDGIFSYGLTSTSTVYKHSNYNNVD